MNNTKLPVSLKNTIELRRLIIENPDLPLLVFCGANHFNIFKPYEQVNVTRFEIKDLTLYREQWIDKESYEYKLDIDLIDEEEYRDLINEEYDKMIEQKVNETEFVKVIVIYVE